MYSISHGEIDVSNTSTDVLEFYLQACFPRIPKTSIRNMSLLRKQFEFRCLLRSYDIKTQEELEQWYFKQIGSIINYD